MSNVLLFNQDFTYITSISWQRAVILILEGKVRPATDKVLKVVRSISREVIVPKIVYLVKFIRGIYKRHVPFSKANVLARDNYVCQYCGGKAATVDHIIPRSKGGPLTWENCVAACEECNIRKGSKSLKEAGLFFIGKQPKQPTISEFLQIKLQNIGIQDTIEDLCNF